MRKCLTLMVMVGWSLGVWAEPGNGWLYWTLDLTDTTGYIETRPTEVAAGTYDVWLVASYLSDPTKTVTFHDSDPQWAERITLDGTGENGSMEYASRADLSALTGNLALYQFYSAIGTYGDAGDEVLWQTDARAYNTVSDYIQSSEISPADIWNTALAPEPTSGFLLLLGLAGLALKRKRA